MSDFDHILDEPGERRIEPDHKDGVAYGKAAQGSLRSGELGLCICIAAYDSEEEVGYMAHIDTYKNREEFRDDVQEFTFLIQQSKEDFSLEDVSFLLGGSCYENPFHNNKDSRVNEEEVWRMGGQRITAEEILKSHSKDVEVNWGAEDGYYSEVVLNTDSEDIFSYNRKKEPINPDL